jgi:hypothetical protein
MRLPRLRPLVVSGLNDVVWRRAPAQVRPKPAVRLSKNLPEAVDKYTSDGRIPTAADFGRSNA